MKKLYFAIFAMLFLTSCSKKEQNSAETTKTSSTEISQVQKPLTLKNSKGENLTVTYFAEGNEVAVKIQKTGQKEQKLSAKGINKNDNPIFTNENFMWEMTQDGKAGKLSDKEGNAMEYVEN